MTKFKKIFSGIIVALLTLLLVSISALAVMYHFGTYTTWVEGTSMQPTFVGNHEKGDNVFASTIKRYSYGDIIVVEIDDAVEEEKLIIKRLIGLEGDLINLTFEDNRLFVWRNGEVVNEDYYSEPIYYEEEPFAFKKFEQLKQNWQGENTENGIIVPKDHVFIMGDNRNTSVDSTSHGPYRVSQVHSVIIKKINQEQGISLFFDFVKYILFNIKGANL